MGRVLRAISSPASLLTGDASSDSGGRQYAHHL